MHVYEKVLKMCEVPNVYMGEEFLYMGTFDKKAVRSLCVGTSDHSYLGIFRLSADANLSY